MVEPSSLQSLKPEEAEGMGSTTPDGEWCQVWGDAGVAVFLQQIHRLLIFF